MRSEAEGFGHSELTFVSTLEPFSAPYHPAVSDVTEAESAVVVAFALTVTVTGAEVLG